MREVNHLQMVSIAVQHYLAKIPLFIRGGFGIGKSEVVGQITEVLANKIPFIKHTITGKDKAGVNIVKKTEHKREYVAWNRLSKDDKDKIYEHPENYFCLFDERLSQYEPSDLRGLPDFTDGRETVVWKVPKWLGYACKKDSAGIIFFDEMNNAAPSIMKAAYQIFLDRGMGEHRITDDWGIFAAGNRIQDRADVFDIPGPLRDRMSEIELKVDTEIWLDWATANNINTSIQGFIKFQPELLLSTGEKVKKDSSTNKRRGGNVSSDMKATTPRGWSRINTFLGLLDAQYVTRDSRYYAELTSLADSTISNEAAVKFAAFVKLKDSVDVDAILKNPKLIKDYTELSMKYAIIGALVDRYKTNKKTYLQPLSEVAVAFKDSKLPDYCVLLLRMMSNEGKQFMFNNLIKQKSWNDLQDVFKKYLAK